MSPPVPPPPTPRRTRDDPHVPPRPPPDPRARRRPPYPPPGPPPPQRAGQGAVHPPAAAVRLRRPGAAHRRQDHGDPPRPPPQGLRRQPEQGGGRDRVGRQAGRGDPDQTRPGAGEGADGGPEQRRRAL